MTNYLVTRHVGAVEWARRRNIEAEWKPHFTADDLAHICAGDTVIGPLPVQIIAAINARGGRYFHIEMDLPQEARQRELSADDMDRFGAERVEYRAERVSAGKD